MTWAIQRHRHTADTSVSAIDDATRVERLPGIGIAAVASLGAGTIHAAVIGIHAENQTLVRVFIAAAVFQVAWGVLSLLKPSVWLAAVGALGNGALVVGWLLTRVSGISFISGLETREPAQFADTACAVLGMVATGLALAGFLLGKMPSKQLNLSVTGLAVAALAIPAMLSATNHTHSHGESTAAHSHDGGTAVDESQPHGHDESGAAIAAPGDSTATTVHSHDEEATASTEHSHGEDSTATTVAAAAGTTETTAHAHEPSVAVPYDPSLPIDLGGTDGVSLQQQARAESLVVLTLARLPQWSDTAVAEAAGFHSIGDAGTGHEHYINWDWINDDVWLDPDYPESLVFEPQPDGSKKLVSVMYMLPDTMTLDDVPDIGGALTQWHIHDNLCFTADPIAPRVAGLTNAQGGCNAPLVKLAQSPMIHVWIVGNPCGPFAALEGVGAGQVNAGEERLCDEAHGSH